LYELAFEKHPTERIIRDEGDSLLLLIVAVAAFVLLLPGCKKNRFLAVIQCRFDQGSA